VIPSGMAQRDEREQTADDDEERLRYLRELARWRRRSGFSLELSGLTVRTDG